MFPLRNLREKLFYVLSFETLINNYIRNVLIKEVEVEPNITKKSTGFEKLIQFFVPMLVLEAWLLYL